jgi:hypothetical protein
LQPLRESVDVRNVVSKKIEEDEMEADEEGERDKVGSRLLFKEVATVRLKEDEEKEEEKEEEWGGYTVPPLI